MKFSQIMFAFVFFGGCSFNLPGHGEKQTYYVLNAESRTVGAAVTKREARLLLQEATTSRLVNTERIIFSEQPATRGSYQFSYWAENPPKRFSYLLQKRLEEVGLFQSVSRTVSGALCDLQLNVEITDFYHNVVNRPGVSVVNMHLELVDLKTRNIIASSYFSKAISTATYNAEGAVQGFDRAVSEVLDEVVLWLAKTL